MENGKDNVAVKKMLSTQSRSAISAKKEKVEIRRKREPKAQAPGLPDPDTNSGFERAKSGAKVSGCSAKIPRERFGENKIFRMRKMFKAGTPIRLVTDAQKGYNNLADNRATLRSNHDFAPLSVQDRGIRQFRNVTAGKSFQHNFTGD